MNVPDPARYHQDTWDDRILPRLAFDARGTEAYWAGRLGIRPGLVSSSSPVMGVHCPHFPSAQDKACPSRLQGCGWFWLLVSIADRTGLVNLHRPSSCLWKRRTGKCTTVSPSPSKAPSALSCTNGRHVSKRNGNATGGSFTPKGIVDFIVAMQRAPLCASIEVVLFCQPYVTAKRNPSRASRPLQKRGPSTRGTYRYIHACLVSLHWGCFYPWITSVAEVLVCRILAVALARPLESSLAVAFAVACRCRLPVAPRIKVWSWWWLWHRPFRLNSKAPKPKAT
ncbi:hypothetical protein CCHR01_04863 [Colletotrichum chrysophilum]|uniref:Uncharacterized protein n=1 Tax=Colletotrichum chrysophilum TaxID=1836956 RepID=A0AAD9AVH0_9PEZI|nr:hypothetical protein CCHR01_04863 [Colletotrichum chrysophilum]